MNINYLIKEITPLYNHYKQNKNKLNGADSLAIMWDIGDTLKKIIEKNNIPPHNLFRSVYGNSENKINVTRKSYITREFQSRCYRIRKIFDSKEQIRKELSNLKTFILFREAMPFFDNVKYEFKGKEKKSLLLLLNSEMPPAEILKKIKIHQKEKIGINNPRTQRLGDVENKKNTFIEFYNFIFRLIKSDSYIESLKKLKTIDTGFINLLAKNTSVLSQEGLKKFEFEVPKGISSILQEYAIVIQQLVSKEDAKERRRFRRLISPERITRLAEMIHAFSSEKKYRDFT